MATTTTAGTAVEEHTRLNTDGLTELIDGEVIEMPPLGTKIQKP